MGSTAGKEGKGNEELSLGKKERRDGEENSMSEEVLVLQAAVHVC